MSSEENSGPAGPTADDPAGRQKSKQAVVEYLQAPRKKRKNYVILAVSENFDGDTIQAISRYMRTQFPKYSFLTAKNREEFEKYSSRNLVLAIVEDQFVGLENTLEMLSAAKAAKKDGPLPVLFLTENNRELIDAYQAKMKLWHEVDEYLILSETPRHALFSRIKSGVESQNQRRSRRYKTQMDVEFQLLDAGEQRFKGTILDFSIHGALLSASEPGRTFSKKDQIVIHLPFGQYVKGKQDILRLSARVRRILISGDKAGVSWEFVSDQKLALLTKLLTTVVDNQLGKAAAAARAKIARTIADEESSMPQ